jgi:membrane protease YdiL (CAAX protease family)
MGVLPMYAIGLPVLLLVVKSMPKRKLETSKMGLGEFLIFFAIAQALMLIGNSIGTALNSFFAAIKGEEISNSTSELIENSPIWITLVVAVIIGPVIEEFIFRKLKIDRLSRYGTGITVFISGFSFGLFHGNFYQFFYAALLGMLLAYITIRTGNWIYSVIMHMLINFFGSVASMPILEMAEEFNTALETFSSGGTVDFSRLLICGLAVTSYVVFQYGLAITGIVLLILALKHRWYGLKNTAEVNIPRQDVFPVVFFNAGTIVFLVTSVLLFGISIILG